MAGSINLANVAIGFNPEKIQRGVAMSGAELRKLGSIVRESVSPVMKYNQEMAILKKANEEGALSAKRFADAQDSLRRKHLEVSQAVGTAGAGVGALMARYASFGAVALGVKKSIGLAAELETNKAAFEVLTGSASQAEEMLRQFVELDRESPISRGEFARASKTLMGFGVDSALVGDRMRNLAQVAMGNNERFQSLALAFGQVTAAGKLTGQEVLQMVNAGFNPLQQISLSTGRSMQDLREDMSDGKIGIDMVQKAFDEATSAGGRFFGMNEKLLNTASGQYAKLQSNIEMTAVSIGESLLPAAKKLMEAFGGGDGPGKGALGMFAETFGIGLEALVTLGSDIALNKNDAKAMGDRLQTEAMQRKVAKDLGLHVNTPEDLEKIKNAALKRQEAELEKRRQADKEKEAAEAKVKEDAKREKERERTRHREDKIRERQEDEAHRIRQKRFDKIERDMERDEKKLKDINKDAGDDVKANIAPALKAGSVEAYKFVLAQKDKAAQVAEKQLEVQKSLVAIANAQLAEMRTTPMLGMVP